MGITLLPLSVQKLYIIIIIVYRQIIKNKSFFGHLTKSKSTHKITYGCGELGFHKPLAMYSMKGKDWIGILHCHFDTGLYVYGCSISEVVLSTLFF